MSGGANEYVMAMQLNASGTLFYHSSGFNDTNIAAYTDITDGIYYSKYYDLYDYGTNAADYSRSKLGDATGETAGWYSVTRSFISSSLGWFVRGGYYSLGSVAGAFNFDTCNGFASGLTGARAVLLLP